MTGATLFTILLACVHPKLADSEPADSGSPAPDSDTGADSRPDSDSDARPHSDSRVDSDSTPDSDSRGDSDSGRDDSGAAPPPPGEVTFVTIPASTFQMGCTASQYDCDPDDDAEHAVTLTHDYEIGVTEVTRFQFMSRMGNDPTYDSPVFVACPFDCPVDQVTWDVAARFTNVMSYEAGLEQCYVCQPDPEGTCMEAGDLYDCGGYRLPTEAEWEAAARCGTDYTYSGSDNVDLVAWYNANWGVGSLSKPREVAGREPNDCGTYDMSGNVSEWVDDYYIAFGTEAVTDPSGHAEDAPRAIRGGHYSAEAYASQVSHRTLAYQWQGSISLGFRVARTLP